MSFRNIRFLILAVAAVFMYACEAESGAGGSQNNSNNTNNANNSENNVQCPIDKMCGNDCCSDDEECVGTQCMPKCDTERCGMECCSNDEECVYNECLPVCENVRCGENLHDCCAEGEICLDGIQCVKDCGDRSLLCGENLDTCCEEGQVCLEDQCVTPGDQCSNIFDCPEGWYCEDTISRCLPMPSGDVCEGQPHFAEIRPVLEWYWSGVTYNGQDYNDILAAPSVGDVNGDGIPDIVVALYATPSGNPNIIAVLSGAGDGHGGPQLLFTIPSASAPNLPEIFWGITPALGNFDDDPGLEIVYTARDGNVVIVDNDGQSTVCKSNPFPSCSGIRNLGTSVTNFGGGPQLVDVNHDGVPDVVVGPYVLDGRNISDPNMDIASFSRATSEPVVADVDGDGHYEFIDPEFSEDLETGAEEWTADRSDWASAGRTTFQAIGDLFPDLAGPEIVFIHDNIYVYSALTGETLVGPGGSLVDGEISIPGGGHGGPPTIADFDGDGLPEVSTAGLRAYVVYDPDCVSAPVRTGGRCDTGREDFILWEAPTQDLSSSETGSSVFDFQGDGAAEVLYNDECFLHIYDGSQGSEVVTPLIPNSSRTYAEYPLVADVDGDGNAEIVVIGNNDQAVNRDHCPESWRRAQIDIDEFCALFDCQDIGECTTTDTGDSTCTDERALCDSSGRCQIPQGTQGVRVYGDYYDMWVRTRPIWNQFSYHVTNVEYDYSLGGWVVPQMETQNWTVYNNFRQNVQGGVMFPVPDLSVTLESAALCPDTVNLVATVRNEGSAGVPPGVRVHFFIVPEGQSAQDIGMTQTQTMILPGGWERVSFQYEGDLVPGTKYYFRASVNEDLSIEECDYSDSEDTAGPVECSTVGK